MLQQAQYIPGWNWGPESKLNQLATEYPYFEHPEERHMRERADTEFEDAALLKKLKGYEDPYGKNFLLHEALRTDCPKRARMGLDGMRAGMRVNPVVAGRTKDETAELIMTAPAYNGTPPQVYGVAWNPFRNQHGDPGS